MLIIVAKQTDEIGLKVIDKVVCRSLRASRRLLVFLQGYIDALIERYRN
jgi:hypothetical protein